MNDSVLSLTDINIRQFAKQGAQLQGRETLAIFPRLLADFTEHHPLPEGTYAIWQARGHWRSADGQPLGAQSDTAELLAQPWLELDIQGVLPCICQRCLQPMRVAVDDKRWFRFVADEEIAEIEDESSEEDVLVESAHFDLHNLLEEELLLALPLVPLHEDCGLPANTNTNTNAHTQTKNQNETQQPFAHLAQLLKQKPTKP